MIKRDCYTKNFELFQSLISFMNDGLSLSDGPLWKKLRRIISQVFHYDFLKARAPHIIEITEENLEGIQNLEKVEILEEMKKITGDTVCRMFFGNNLSKTIINGKVISLTLADTVNDLIT